MKTIIPRWVAAGMGLVLLGGCIVSSVYPFYNAKDLIFDPGLAGRWSKAGATNEFWQFSASGEKSYLLTTSDANATNVFSVHLFRLQEYQFLDLLTTNRADFELPLHLVSWIKRGETNASLHFMDYGWLADYLETNPVVLRHLVVADNADDTNSSKMMYLTASTRDLQVFLVKHMDDTNLFSTNAMVELDRVSP